MDAAGQVRMSALISLSLTVLYFFFYHHLTPLIHYLVLVLPSNTTVSTAAAVESALMITNQTNKFDAQTSNSLSFQQMISCDKENLACNGGNIVSSI